jgi:hypothetical protein
MTSEDVPAVVVTRDELAVVLAAILEDYRSPFDTYTLGPSAHYVKPETFAILIMKRLRERGHATTRAVPPRRKFWALRRYLHPPARRDDH